MRRLILNFHGVGEPSRPLDVGEEGVWISRSQFGAFVDTAAAQGSCDITFDDGNKSDVEIALPMLAERGLSATFFVLSGRIGSPGFLDERDIRCLLASGMKIGLHGSDHVSWRTADHRLLTHEIDHARTKLEDIAGCPVTEAACPFGDYRRATLNHLRNVGFAAVYTSDGGLAEMRGWLRPRRTIRSTDRPELIRQLFSEPFAARVLRSAKISVKKLR